MSVTSFIGLLSKEYQKSDTSVPVKLKHLVVIIDPDHITNLKTRFPSLVKYQGGSWTIILECKNLIDTVPQTMLEDQNWWGKTYRFNIKQVSRKTKLVQQDTQITKYIKRGLLINIKPLV